MFMNTKRLGEHCLILLETKGIVLASTMAWELRQNIQNPDPFISMNISNQTSCLNPSDLPPCKKYFHEWKKYSPTRPTRTPDAIRSNL